MTPSEVELTAALTKVFGGGVVQVERRPSIYATSHVIEDVTVRLAGGERVDLLLKTVGEHGLMDGARAAKPRSLRDARREIVVYERLLAAADLGTAACRATGYDWLLLEKVRGVELYQVGDVAVWQAVAAWLAGAHRRLAACAAEGDETWRRLIDYGPALYQRWATRMAAALEGTGHGRWARRIAGRYAAVIDRLVALPRTIVHGELYASNVLVSVGSAAVERVCPVDWEMAGVAPGLLDLAALVAGGWDDVSRARIARGYLDVTGHSAEELDVCRLHIAVQWLGWAPGWDPPSEHAHDWLSEAQGLAERLDL